MVEIQCDCGKFKADIARFPEETPGQLGCYCDDCQSYLIYLGRTDVLDQAGCTTVVPVYPQNITFKEGAELLRCTLLSPNGTFRWSSTCCNSPIANTMPGMPWVGLHARTYTQKDKLFLKNTVGPIQSRILGKFAKGAPAPGTPQKMNFKAIATVLPFIVKGKLFKKMKDSPFFKADGKTPIVDPYIFSAEERTELKNKFEQITHY